MNVLDTCSPTEAEPISTSEWRMQRESAEWQAGSICCCCADVDVCCRTIWCPCLTYKDIRNALHGGYAQESCDPALLYFLVCCFTGCQCILGMMTRSEIRRKYGLKTCCCDCWAHFCCHPCAMCQELRELKSRPLTPWANGADARPPAMRYSFAHQGHAGYSFVPSSPSVGSTPPKTPPEYASKPPKVVEYPDHHL